MDAPLGAPEEPPPVVPPTALGAGAPEAVVLPGLERVSPAVDPPPPVVPPIALGAGAPEAVVFPWLERLSFRPGSDRLGALLTLEEEPLLPEDEDESPLPE